MEFTQEEIFDRNEYDKLVTRIQFDKRDAASYHNMLDFLWPYVIDQIHVEDREGLLEEYLHWNGQLMDICYVHLPHDLPYLNTRRAWQAVVCTLAGKTKEAQDMLSLIGDDHFQKDGYAPKKIMVADGTIYEPMSGLFPVYNLAKYYRHKGMVEEETSLRQHYDYAFTLFDDGDHDLHDQFLQDQMDTSRDKIFYPVFDRVYKIEFGQPDFYLFYDKDRQFPVEDCL